ncbi:MAG: hypothetical protein RML72_12835 [Bacteroidia bacterium]|nr:hypothetical protein [Bacteroidia bacterium]MDW8159744.1 hypothetical protein [Bacteroidia bacterium]
MNQYLRNLTNFLSILFLFFLYGAQGPYYSLGARVYTYTPSTKLHPSALTLKMQVVLPLSGEWYDENHQKWQVPFWVDEKKELTLYKDFFLPFSPKDTLYLYFEGIAWSSEIYLNNRLLLLYYQPFEETLITLPPSLLNKQWNQIKVKLYSQGVSYDWYPPKMLGIHRNVFLLQKKEDFLYSFSFPKVVQADTTLFYAPFSYTLAYNLGESTFRLDMTHIKNKGFNTIYFPFQPPHRLLQIVAELGLNIAERPGKIIAFYNTYPTQTGKYYPGWYNAGIVDSSQINKYYLVEEFIKAPPQKHSHNLWTIIGLFLLLVIWKLIDTPSFNRLVMWQKGATGASSEAFPYHRWVLSYILIVRIVTSSCLLYFCYQLANLFEYPLFNYFRSQEDTFASSTTIFLEIFTLISIYSLLKYVLIALAGTIYRFSDLWVKLLNIEARASFPTNLLLVALVFIVWIGLPFSQIISTLLCIILLGIHILRKYYLIYNEFNTTLKIPVIINFLYICIVEWVPWLLLL